MNKILLDVQCFKNICGLKLFLVEDYCILVVFVVLRRNYYLRNIFREKLYKQNVFRVVVLLCIERY